MDDAQWRAPIFWVISARNRTSIQRRAVAHIWTQEVCYFISPSHLTHTHILNVWFWCSCLRLFDCLPCLIWLCGAWLTLLFVIAFDCLFLICFAWFVLCLFANITSCVNGCDVCVVFFHASAWFIWNVAMTDELLQYFWFNLFVFCESCLLFCYCVCFIHSFVLDLVVCLVFLFCFVCICGLVSILLLSVVMSLWLFIIVLWMIDYVLLYVCLDYFGLCWVVLFHFMLLCCDVCAFFDATAWFCE